MSKHLVFTHSATEAEVLHSSLVLLGRVPWCWLLGSGCSTIAWTLNPKLAASQRSGVKRRSCCSRARLRGPPPNTGTPNFHTLSQTFTGKVLSHRAHTGAVIYVVGDG